MSNVPPSPYQQQPEHPPQADLPTAVAFHMYDDGQDIVYRTQNGKASIRVPKEIGELSPESIDEIISTYAAFTAS